jgi:hypothetical protein
MLEMKSKRPFLVTLLSAFLIFGFAVTVLLLAFNTPISIETDLAAQCGVTRSLWRNFGMDGLRAEFVVLGLGGGIVGVGLWRLRPWARTAVMAFCLFEVSIELAGAVELYWKHSCTSNDMTGAFLSIFFLLYFLRKKIKAIYCPSLSSSESAV